MDDPTRFAAVLNGVVKHSFEGELHINPEFIKEQVFPSDEVSLDGTPPQRITKQKNLMAGTNA